MRCRQRQKQCQADVVKFPGFNWTEYILVNKDSSYSMWMLFFFGFCMGTADLIPGISGGTVAFILGFYPALLSNLKAFNLTTIQLFFKGNWEVFFKKISWRFFIPLFLGIGTAFITLANFFYYLLSHEMYKMFVYSTFFGLILASFYFCIRQIKQWKGSLLIFLFLGCFIGFFLSGSPMAKSSFIHFSSPIYFHGWLMFSGLLAVCALLLPGLSGSYVLTLLDVYPKVIEALVVFVNGLALGTFDVGSFTILGSLALGIVIGGIACARMISWLLSKFPNEALAVLSGFMIGAIRSVWPFWTYEPFLVQPYIPSLTSPLLWQAAFFSVIGIAVLFGMEILVKKSSVKKHFN